MGLPSTEEQQKFYDRFWAQRSKNLNSWEVQRLSRVLGGIAVLVQTRHANLAICDLGCGTGWMSNELRKFGRVVGVDFSDEGLRQAREAYPEVTFVHSNVLTYRPDEQFDLVVSSEVIEHIPDKDAYFETIEAILKAGGYLILTCPNGDVRPYYGVPGQMIEEWPTKQQLRRLVRKHLVIVLYDSFVHNFANRGVMRVLNSPKLNRLLKRLGLHALYLALRGLCGYGLFHLILAQKPR
jgi:2-polyprenyl-3-methyl-5-hydroxy-6-metoxy-1,4-benzoquinol methylase